VLDENLRIVERLERSGDAAEFVHRVARSYADRPAVSPQTLRQQAPCCSSRGYWMRSPARDSSRISRRRAARPPAPLMWKATRPSGKPDPSVKMRRDVYLDGGVWLDRVKDALVRRVLPEIQRCFNFTVTQHEVFKLIRYDAGAGYFHAHRDNESRDTAPTAASP